MQDSAFSLTYHEYTLLPFQLSQTLTPRSGTYLFILKSGDKIHSQDTLFIHDYDIPRQLILRESVAGYACM